MHVLKATSILLKHISMNNYRIDMGNITRVIKSHVTHSFASFTLHDAFSIVQSDHLWKHFTRTISFLNYNGIDHGML